MTSLQPEGRNEKVGVAVTPSEKRAVVAVSSIRETDQSNLLRDHTITEIVEEFLRLQQVAGAA